MAYSIKVCYILHGATIGAISINEYPVCTKQGILGIVPNTNINVEYLYLLMSSSYFSKEISRIITEGTMKTAYLKDINHIKCPLPSMAQQKNITKLNILNRGKTVYRTGTFKVLEFTETISIAHDIYINNIRSR